MQKAAGNAQTLHRGDHLAPNQTTLAHAADDQLSTCQATVCDCFYSPDQSFSSMMVGFVQDCDLGERSGCG